MKKIMSMALAILMIIMSMPIIKAEGTAKVTGISIDGEELGINAEKKMEKSGGTLNVIVSSENLDDLKCMLNYDGDRKPVEMYANDILTYSKRNLKNGFMLTITLPANETESDKEYLFRFKATSYNDASLKVIVSGKEETDEPSPEPNPNPGEDPEPNPGEDTSKAEILGMDMGDGKLVKTFSENIKNESKTYTAIVKTKNVDKLQIKYTMNGMFNKPGVTSNIIKTAENEFKVTLIVAENFAKSCKKYEISIGHGDIPGDYSDGIKLNINIDGTSNLCTPGGNDEDPIERVATISRVSDTESIAEDVLNMTIDSKEQDKKVYLTLINGDILKDGELDALIEKDGVIDFSIKTTFSGDKNARIATIHFPENTEGKDVVYEVTFKIKNKLQNSKKVTINQTKKAEEEKQTSIELFTLTNENIPLSGGSVRASVFGENIDTSKLSVKVFDGDSDISGSMTMSPFIGREDVATSDITFKESVEDKSYILKLYYAGEEKMAANLVQNKYGSNNDSINFQANRIFKAGNKIITEFTHDIFEAYPNALKDNTEIAFDGTADIEKHEGKYVKAEPKFEKLKDADTVEIQGNKIIVTLAEEREFKNAPKIRFGFRTFKNPEGIYNGRKDNKINSYFIQDGNGIILSADFISDKVFTSDGGDVELKIHGIELSDDENVKSHTRVKIIKMENLKKESEQTEVPYTLEGKGTEQTLKFTLPKNTSKRTESYTILLSTDGRVYVSDVNATANDRANLLVVSVLPEGKNKDDMTLGFARIQSYGTNGGSTEKPDLTHTIPPLGQESKKTWVTIYGTNLKNPMTKIRAKAEVPAGSGKYVYWYPVNEGTQDSGDKFIMVGVSKGLYGKDNVQMLEVIAPRGYRGNINYTYEIAIDGVNYDTELTTTVTLLDDGEDQGIRKKHEVFTRDLPIKYEDESGKEIKAAESIYVMKNMPLRVVGIDKAPQIDGYKYNELKGLNKDLNKELAKIDMLRKLAENGTITAEERQELAKLEQWVKDHKDIEFDTVIGDIDELIFVYEKLGENIDPQPQPEPEPQPEPDTQPVPDYDVVVRPRPRRRPDTNGKKEEIKPEEKKEVKAEEKQDAKVEENTIQEPIGKETLLDVKEPSLPVNLKDIPNDDFGVAIKNMVSRGVLLGTSETKFSPDVTISRAMVTEVFRRLATDKNAGENVKFEDVKDDAWYAESVKWAAFMNIIKGYENGTFKPNQKVTRQEFAIMICRMLDAFNIELPKGSKVDLTQFGSLENWSKDAVIRVLQEGLLKIEPNGEFGPKSFVSRKELALVLDKIVKFTMSK